MIEPPREKCRVHETPPVAPLQGSEAYNTTLPRCGERHPTGQRLTDLDKSLTILDVQSVNKSFID
jgi:hypothetical protein